MARPLRWPLPAAATVFGAALLFFLGFEWVWVGRSGFWVDELFALWAGDPSQPFRDALRDRILPDTNPPLYFSLLYGMHKIIPEGRAAILWLNGLGLVGLLGLLLWIGQRAQMLTMALLAGAFFLVTAPALSYAPEGRAYVLAMAASLNAAFLAATCLAGSPAERTHVTIAALLAT